MICRASHILDNPKNKKEEHVQQNKENVVGIHQHKDQYKLHNATSLPPFLSLLSISFTNLQLFVCETNWESKMSQVQVHCLILSSIINFYLILFFVSC